MAAGSDMFNGNVDCEKKNHKRGRNHIENPETLSSVAETIQMKFQPPMRVLTVDISMDTAKPRASANSSRALDLIIAICFLQFFVGKFLHIQSVTVIRKDCYRRV